MKKLIFVFISLLFLSFCKKESETFQTVNYQNYLNDMQVVSVIDGTEDCAYLTTIFETLKTIDGKERLYRLSENTCNFEYIEVLTKSSDKLTDELSNIFNSDQSVREEFGAFIKTKNLNFSEETDIFKVMNLRKFYWDSITKETDSLNLKRFSEILETTAEWIGAEYLKRTNQNPKLGILVGHFPEKTYMKYTLMAYESATNGKEFWNNVEIMISFSKKYSIEDTEYYKKRKSIIPFRFTKYKSPKVVDENSDLTQLEFTSIANVRFGGNYYYELSSSIENEEKRKKLLMQAKNLLIKLGRDKKAIKIKEEIEPHKEYKLYYQIIQ